MSRPAEVLLLIALLLALGLAAFAGRHDRPAPDRDLRLSTRNPGPSGAKGLAEVLRTLGVAVEERRSPFFGAGESLPIDGSVVAVLAPRRPLTLVEGRALATFVERGGRLVLVGRAANPAAVCFGWRTQSASAALALSEVRDAPEVDDVLEVIAPDSVRALGRFDELPCEPVAVAGVDTLLERTDGEPVAVRVDARDGGSVTVIAAAGLLRNRTLRETSLGPWAVRLFTRDTPPRVIVDEYHHGYAESGSLRATWGWLTSAPLGRALLQLAAVSLVALAVSAIRFGPAVPVLERRRRSPLEHVDALAAGLAGARGAAPAVALMVDGLRRRVSRAVQAPQGDIASWLDGLACTTPAVRGRAAAAALSELVRRGPRTDADVLRAAHSVEDLWEALRRQ